MTIAPTDSPRVVDLWATVSAAQRQRLVGRLRRPQRHARPWRRAGRAARQAVDADADRRRRPSRYRCQSMLRQRREAGVPGRAGLLRLRRGPLEARWSRTARRAAVEGRGRPRPSPRVGAEGHRSRRFVRAGPAGGPAAEADVDLHGSHEPRQPEPRWHGAHRDLRRRRRHATAGWSRCSSRPSPPTWRCTSARSSSPPTAERGRSRDGGQGARISITPLNPWEDLRCRES